MDEIISIVDDNDRVVGSDTRDNVHASGRWHRGIHIFVLNEDGEMLLKVLPSADPKFTSVYDCPVSEHVLKDEDFDKAAVRGIKGLGIQRGNLKQLVKFKMNYGPNDNMISALYEIRVPGKPKLDSDTFKGEFFVFDSFREMLRAEKSRFTPTAYELLMWFTGDETKVEPIINISKYF